MRSVLLCLVAASTALDATFFRRTLNPYVLYDFMDADQNGFATTTATDKASHGVITFGGLNFGSRASWLKGRPGVAMTQEKTLTVSAAMSSNNNFSTSWMSYFNNTFVVELWFQTSARFDSSTFGSIFSLSRAITSAAQSGPVTACNATEPMMDLSIQSEIYFRTAVNASTTCAYSLACSYAQQPTPYVVPLFMRYDPSNANWTAWTWMGTTLSSWYGYGSSRPLKWTDNTAKLYFSNSNNWGNTDFNLASFAIYPDLTDTQINALFQKGLPNAKPIAPNIQRAVSETTGGMIHLCPNVAGTPRDSDCLDYTNNVTASGHVHSLTPSSDLLVTILSLPTKGTLSQGGVVITAVPFSLNSTNIVMYTPPPDVTSWYAQWSSFSSYSIFKLDFTWFTYMVQDPDGAQSNVANVTIEVYPRHTPPFSINISQSQSLIFAGRAISSFSLANSISLQAVNTEFLRPDSANLVCTESLIGPAYVMCLNAQDHPAPATTVVTITGLPSIGTLYYRNTSGSLVPVVVGTNVSADQTSCLSVSCAWYVWYNVSSSAFNSTNVILGRDRFTYTATTTFDLQKYMNYTRYIVDSVGAIQPVNFSPQAVSSEAGVDVDIKNGFYAQSSISSVFQRNLTTIVPQKLDLIAADLTVSNPTLQFVISSLPNKGGLFLPGQSVPISVADLPATLPNSSVFYQPSLPSESYGFEFGSNYASFNFYVISTGAGGGRMSNTALQVINVADTNDAVTILWSPTASVLVFRRVGNPQIWSDLTGNELRVYFTDPDLPQPNEPYYQVTIDSANLDFFVFLSDSVWNDLQVEKPQGRGQRIGGPVAGAGASTWQFIVPRDLAERALMSIRLRPNVNVLSTILTVTIQDCIFVAGLTDPKFQGALWQGSTTQVNIVLSGVVVSETSSPSTAPTTSTAPTANTAPSTASIVPSPAGSSPISAATAPNGLITGLTAAVLIATFI